MLDIKEREFGNEKIISNSKFMPVNFLHVGSERADAVCKIECSDGHASGFLISQRLLMTNNHVFSRKDEARTAAALFHYATKFEFSIKFDPETLFVTSPELDCTIIAIVSTPKLKKISPICLFAKPGASSCANGI